MSNEIKHNFRFMIIDIEEDKVVVDEFCDAVVAGIATNGCKPGFTDSQEILACKCGLLAGTAAVGAAEKAVMTQKKQIIKSFMEKATPEEIMKCFGGECDEDDR